MSLIKPQGKIVDRAVKENSSAKLNNANLVQSNSQSHELNNAASESTIRQQLFE